MTLNLNRVSLDKGILIKFSAVKFNKPLEK